MLPSTPQLMSALGLARLPSYPRRDPGETSAALAQAQEQIEASRRAWSRTTVPLSSKGIMLQGPKQWATRCVRSMRPL
jgi:hypothetical protein